MGRANRRLHRVFNGVLNAGMAVDGIFFHKTFGQRWLTATAAGFFDEVEQGGKWDWSLGIEAELDDAKLGLAYLDSDAGRPALVAQSDLASRDDARQV